MKSKRAFTLVELVVVVLIVGVLLAVRVGTLDHDRAQASVRADVAKLRLIGQASAMYAEDNQDRLFAFSWRPGVLPDTPNTELAIACGNLNPFSSGHETRAAVYQQLDLVTRGFEHDQLPPVPSTAPSGHTPWILYNHLVLAHYMGEGLPSETFISSKDKRRNYWRENTDKYLDNPVGGVYRPPSTATSFRDLWRWAFSSSFMVGPSHFSNDIGSFSNNPIPRTAERANTNRSWRLPTVPGVLGNRLMSEVAHPSLKVMMFDEYDRSKAQYFGLETSASTMVFYDGSAGRFSTASANYGFQPNDPDRGADAPDDPASAYFYFYAPIAWWDPPGATRVQLPVYYDQTRNGLQGIDYSPGSVRRPIRGQFGE